MDKQLRNRIFFWFGKHLFQVGLLSLCTLMFYGKPVSVSALETGQSSLAPVARLENWRFDPEALQLEISLSAASAPRYFYLAQPSRIVVDLPSTKLGNIPTQQNFSGAIRSIRVSQFNTDVTRIVMDLAPGTFIDPNQVQLQPVSRNNPNRWILRPLVASDRSSFPTQNLPPQPSNFSPTTITPPQPPSNLPSATYNPPQPPSNLPSATYNPPQVTDFNVPPPLTTTLPPTTNNFPQTPSVRVPPFTPYNSSQQPSSSSLPPSSFPYQPSNPNNTIPSVRTPDFPIPSTPSSDNSGVIEFGQPFPNSTR